VLRQFWPFWVFLGLAAVFAKALIGIDRGAIDPHAIQSPLLGKRAPEFDLPSVLDPTQRVRLQDSAGRYRVINVWGSWCVACKAEHEALLKLHLQQSIQFIGIDWKDDPSTALEYVRKLGNPYDAIADDQAGQVAIDYGVYGAPESFLISPQGIVLAKHTGPLTEAAFAAEFAPLMKPGATS